MTRSCLLAIAALVCSPRPGTAQPVEDADEPLTVERLVAIAVDASSTLQRARAAKRTADLGEVIAGAPGEWQLDARVGAERAHDSGVDSSTITADLGISKQLATGGTIALAVSGTDQSTALTGLSASATQPSEAEAAQGTAKLTLTQPLLRGRSMGANIDTRRAELVAEAARYELAEAQAAALRDLIAAYWELAYARATVAVRASSLAVAKEQLALTKHMLERGAVPESAIAAARYGVALREEALLRATDDVQSQSLALRKAAGMEVGPDLGDIAPTDDLVTDDRTWSVDATLDVALAHNPRVVAAKRGIVVASVDVERAENGVLPRIDVSVGGGLAGNGNAPGAALHSLGRGAYVVDGALTVHWEVGGATRAVAKAARIGRSNARLTAKDVERDVMTAVIDGVHRLRAAQQRAAVAHAAVDLAKTNLATEQALFRADKSNNVQVFQRENELAEARLLEARAAADSKIELVTLEYLAGHLLARYRVEAVVAR